MESEGRRNKYAGPSIQIEIIEACNSVLLNKVANRAKKAKFFSVLADETTYISGLATSIIENLTKLGSDIENLRGKGYYEAS
ncbi:hypothetical protein PR048_009391 [Dryococelus australis]|uniref:DUF4371 domain-containing protein n=1 Tax=Dryococelus australis TaxID=614101 RepID=A0ABQ9HZS3_9NEOP|nr:hypothetical protein PR048_009391 [Dryococelus australis]